MGLAEALRAYEARGSLEGWIKTVAFRAAYRRNRSSKRRAEVSLDDAPRSATAQEAPPAQFPGAPPVLVCGCQICGLLMARAITTIGGVTDDSP
ncbi:MAG: hypothetical protein ACE5HT_12185 [Gemmatimonadales bacterium]